MLRRDRPRDPAEMDERYQQLVELAPDAILIHDGEHIVLVNYAALALAGATRRDTLVGQPIANFLEPPYLKAAQAELLGNDDHLHRAPPVRDKFRRIDGSIVDVEVSAIPFMDVGSLAVHLVIRDITERLEAEQAAHQMDEKLRQAQRMEAVGALAGGVAHEVNNMMTVILGFSEFMLKDPSLSGERLSDVRDIAKAADRAASVTAQLLAFSRRAFHRPEVLDLNVAVKSLEPVIRRVLGENRSLIIASGSSALALADPGQLEQVLVNMTLNARDAMPGQGTFMINTGETELAEPGLAVDGIVLPAGRYARIILRDTGTGMDAATQARIFEPFFTTKPVGRGTGLGLSAVYGIVKQSGGYITLDSTEGRGSTFTLYFPIAIAAEIEHPAEPVAPGWVDRRSRRTILLVEDEAVVRRMASRILEQAGFRVIQAGDGVAALDSVERDGLPDLVITDLVMPGMDGSELARRLRRQWPTLPILFMSGYSHMDHGREGVSFEGEVLQKPFTIEELLRRVVEAVSKGENQLPSAG